MRDRWILRKHLTHTEEAGIISIFKQEKQLMQVVDICEIHIWLSAKCILSWGKVMSKPAEAEKYDECGCGLTNW